MASSDLYDLCRELLEACAEALTFSINGAPPRQFVSAGLPAFDCEQLTVHAGGTTEAYTLPVEPPMQPGLRAATTAKLNLVQMTATIIRCSTGIPTNTKTAPSPVKLDNDAKVVLADLWVIWNHLFTLKKNDTLFPPDHRAMFFDPAVALPISGGVAGWEIPFRVQLDGYRTI